jgi:hypothetical protein
MHLRGHGADTARVRALSPWDLRATGEMMQRFGCIATSSTLLRMRVPQPSASAINGMPHLQRPRHLWRAALVFCTAIKGTRLRVLRSSLKGNQQYLVIVQTSPASISPTTLTAKTLRRLTMGNKKNGLEVFSSWVKKEGNPQIRVPLLVSIARVLYENGQPYDGWNDVHLPGAHPASAMVRPGASRIYLAQAGCSPAEHPRWPRVIHRIPKVGRLPPIQNQQEAKGDIPWRSGLQLRPASTSSAVAYSANSAAFPAIRNVGRRHPGKASAGRL